MPRDPAAVLSSLLRASSITDHEEILRAADAASKASKTDFTSRHTRVVALLKLDRYDDALRAIAEGGTKLGAICGLEHAYALYKTGKLEEATALLQATGLEKRGLTHVAAQVAYRAERFDEASTIYRRLLDAEDDDTAEENDLQINLRAACAQVEWQGFSSAKLPGVQDSDGFELCYNAACTCIARGDVNSAADLLQRALRLCDASEDLSEKEKEGELRSIQAQQAFVNAKQGRLQEAIELCRSLSTTSNNDIDFSVIIQNNLLAIDSKPANPYLLLRDFELATKGEAEAKLFGYQSRVLQRNGLIFSLEADKASGVKSRTNKILHGYQHPSAAADVNVASVLNAVASVQGAEAKHAIRSLIALASKRPYDVGLVLTIIQLQLQNDQSGAALSTLESFLQRLEKAEQPGAKDIRFGPGLVALAVSLMRNQGRESSAKSELAKAAKYWQLQLAGSAAPLLREAGVELLKSSNHQDLELAGSCFQKLFDEQQGSHIVAAGLVASLAPSDPAKVEKHLEGLPPVESLIAEVDVARLVNAGVATVPKSSQASKRPAQEPAAASSNKRRRKIRLPKNYEEGKKPDPERWLPLRDRSTYRPKGKKGKKKALDATQGGIVKEEETLELVGGGGVKVEKAPAQSSSKKKKKGKK